MGDLELDTRLSGADGRYTITLSRNWEIWSEDGRLVAMGGAQLLCMPDTRPGR